MSIQGQCHFGQRSFFKHQISGVHSQDQWSSDETVCINDEDGIQNSVNLACIASVVVITKLVLL